MILLESKRTKINQKQRKNKAVRENGGQQKLFGEKEYDEM
jgi:hypothetical protein